MCYDGLLQSNMQIMPFYAEIIKKVSESLYLLTLKKLSLYPKTSSEMISN